MYVLARSSMNLSSLAEASNQEENMVGRFGMIPNGGTALSSLYMSSSGFPARRTLLVGQAGFGVTGALNAFPRCNQPTVAWYVTVTFLVASNAWRINGALLKLVTMGP